MVRAFSSRSRRRRLKAPRRAGIILPLFPSPWYSSLSLSPPLFSHREVRSSSSHFGASSLPSSVASAVSSASRLAERLFITGLAFILDLHNLNTEPDARGININIVFPARPHARGLRPDLRRASFTTPFPRIRDRNRWSRRLSGRGRAGGRGRGSAPRATAVACRDERRDVSPLRSGDLGFLASPILAWWFNRIDRVIGKRAKSPPRSRVASRPCETSSATRRQRRRRGRREEGVGRGREGVADWPRVLI